MKEIKPVERVWANMALLVALGTVLVAVIRVYWWSGFYVPVALTVLSVADRTTLLASTLLIVLIALMPLLVPELLSSASLDARALFKLETPALVSLKSFAVLFGLGLLLYGFTSLSVALAIGGLLGLIALGWLVVVVVLWIRKGRDSAVSAAKARLFADGRQRPWTNVIFFSGTVLIATLGQSWVPLERIDLVSTTNPVVGYVIGAQEGFTLIVDERQNPLWVSTNSIGARELCTRLPNDMWGRTFGDLFSPTLLPSCPSADTLVEVP